MQELDRQSRPYDPELYDLTHRGNPGDVEFYRQVCLGAAAVLELGCGSGRLGVDLARAGCSWTGLDQHAGMLARLAARVADLPAEIAARMHWQVADMTDFCLPERFDRVIIPYNGLFCLLSERAVDACLRRIRCHLAPGGRLVFDVYRVFTPDPDPEAAPEDDPDPVVTLSDGDVWIEVFERSDWDQPSQRIDAWYRYRFVGADAPGDQEYCIPQRYLFPEQIAARLQAAGLATTARYGDFDRSPFADDSETLVVVAEPINGGSP